MTNEKLKYFENAFNFIKNKNYTEAIVDLNKLLNNNDDEILAYTNYLLGYINTQFDYKQRNKKEARRLLYSNINSNYPCPHAFVLYAELESDNNIAENYLLKGIALFPNETSIYEKLLEITNNKDEVVRTIKARGLHDAQLLGKSLAYLVSSQNWSEVVQFINILQQNNNLTTVQDLHLNIIYAYALMFKDDPNFNEAQNCFKRIILVDTDNYSAYSHYIGFAFSCLKLGETNKAIEYFDKIPLTNSVYDLTERPYPFGIYIDFNLLYKEIFESFNILFANDAARKSKAAVIYILYLYHPAEILDQHRYRKTDTAILKRYLKNNFNQYIAIALYNMKCHFRQYKEAYDTLWILLHNYVNLDNLYISFSDVSETATNKEIQDIVDCTLTELNSEDYDRPAFLSTVFSELIKRLHTDEQYKQIKELSDHFSIKEILETSCAFECAYAYGTDDNPRSIEIYKSIVKKEPDNSSAINNLGVQYEHQNDFYKALECYEKALSLIPSKELYKNNLNRIHDQVAKQLNEDIISISSSITCESINTIGYTTDLCKKILTIKDNDMKDIIFRDLKECVIAVVAGQDKTAAIMCGSIAEALLMQKIFDFGTTKYDITEISKSKYASNYPIQDMALNELSYVAEKEKIITKNTFHLIHYIRDYRNMVHPAKEMRMKENFTHNDVLTMWSVLIRIIDELL